MLGKSDDEVKLGVIAPLHDATQDQRAVTGQSRGVLHATLLLATTGALFSPPRQLLSRILLRLRYAHPCPHVIVAVEPSAGLLYEMELPRHRLWNLNSESELESSHDKKCYIIDTARPYCPSIGVKRSFSLHLSDIVCSSLNKYATFVINCVCTQCSHT